ncbi:MAG: hypothetical protein ACKV2T_10665 [Kofleriaceae bacterium]
MRALCVGFALVIAVGACDGDGVSLEVDRGETAATRVELYVVDGLCTTDAGGEQPCPQLKTPAAMTYLDGEVYTRKDARAFAADVESDGIAYFTIRSNGDKTRVPLAAAVGFDDDGALVAAALLEFEVYTTDYMRVQLVLEPIVEDRVTGRPSSDGLRVETWYDDPTVPDRIGCLAFERTKDATTDRKFIVPADDLDCDGWLPDQGECDAIWPHHGLDDQAPPGQPFTCAAQEAAAADLTQCLLGDSLCIDGEGPVECKPVTFDNGERRCVPSAVCDRVCNPNNNYGCILGALRNPMQFGANHPSFVRCTIPVWQDANMLAVCSGDVDAVLATTWNVPIATTCSELSIGAVTSIGLGPFTTMRSSQLAPINTVRTSVEGNCSLKLRFSGDFADTANIADALPSQVLKLDLSNGASVLVPLVVELDLIEEPACANAQAVCSLVTSDGTGIDESLAACIRL